MTNHTPHSSLTPYFCARVTNKVINLNSSTAISLASLVLLLQHYISILSGDLYQLSSSSSILPMEFFDDGDYELREIQKLEGHTDRVWCLSWNPKTGINGGPPIIASCSGDKTIRIWEQSGPSQSWRCKVFFSFVFFTFSWSCISFWFLWGFLSIDFK